VTTSTADMAFRSLVDVVDARLSEAPDATALVADGAAFSRAELKHAAQRAADRLAASGVRPGDLVGLLVERNANSVIWLLGVLTLGAAYVPLDPSYPADRLRFMVEDSGVAVVVGSQKTAERAGLTGVRLIDPEQPPVPSTPRRAAADGPGREDTAYVLYTSGSTGTPKGCIITHGNVLALLDGALARFDFAATDRWALFHSLCFDFSVWELWCALGTGATAVMVPWSTALSAEELVEFVSQHRITVLNQVPSVFWYTAAAHADMGRPQLGLRYLFVGGETVNLDTVRDFLSGCGPHPPTAVNVYGLTENTVIATSKILDAQALASGVRSPIGRPLPHLQAHVLTEHGEAVPDGGEGELWLSGSSLSVGYFRRDALNAERFVALPVGPGGTLLRCYRTGDVVRRLGDGELEYLGRADDQIKLRGLRVELREIEIALNAHPQVRDSAVCVIDTFAGPELRGCLVCTCAVDASMVDSVKALLRRTLPEHMVPREYVAVDRLPLTPSGKLDRKALRGFFGT
jgi:amino acid adenylation domain-containing protein